MNFIDLVIVAAVGFFLIKGLVRGFFKEIFGLAGLIISLIVATKFMSNVSVTINEFLNVPPTVASLLAFLVIFFGLFLSFQLVAHILQKAFKYSMLGWLEKLGGGVVGFLKGATIVSLLVLFVSIIPFGPQLLPQTRESVLFRPMQNFAPHVFNFLMTIAPNSKSFYDELIDNFDNFGAGEIKGNTQEFLKSFQNPVPEDPDPDEPSR